MGIFYNRYISTFLFLLVLVVTGCQKNELRQHSRYYLMKDLKRWEPYVPLGYNYIPKQGVDSFIGDIANDSIRFSFDYGAYGGTPPADLETIKALISRDKKSCQRIMEICDVQMTLEEFLKAFEVVDVKNENGKFSVDIVCHDNYLVMDDLDIYERYLLEAAALRKEKKDFSNYHSILYYPHSDHISKAGIVIKEKNTFNNLNFYTLDYTLTHHDEIMKVLGELRDNYELYLREG